MKLLVDYFIKETNKKMEHIEKNIDKKHKEINKKIDKIESKLSTKEKRDWKFIGVSIGMITVFQYVLPIGKLIKWIKQIP
jgi:hypothetical protein